MYNSTVKIGNWREDVEIEKEKLEEFIKKREGSNLLVQRTRRLLDNLLREIRLSNRDEFVKFGNCVQVKAPDMPRFPRGSRTRNNNSINVNNNYGVVMTGTVHDKHIDKISSFVNDCRLVASPMHDPCVRNSFVITSADSCDKTGQNLLFGQEFVLRIVDSAEPLYVRVEKPFIGGYHGSFNHSPVQLSNKKDRYSIWKVLSWDKKMRFESEGAPFPPFSRVIIQNLMSGLNLAVEGSAWSVSIFGNECGLSVHTYVNSAKRETAECLWMFVTQDSNKPPVDSNESRSNEKKSINL